jgi:O-antigen/teichoic acid export membrane protein
MRLRAAVLTGSVAKVLAVAVQLVAVGTAARALGTDAFGSYLVIAALVAWLGLAAVGVGPGLTQRVAIATAHDDAGGQAIAFSSSVSLAGLFVLLVAAAVFIVASVAIGGEPANTALSSDIRSAALLLVCAAAVQVWLSVVEAAQLGHQEQYFTNVFQAAGLGCVLVLLLAVGSSLATVTGFVVVTAYPPLLAKIGNAAFYIARHRYLLTRHVSIGTAAGILSTSLAFAAVSLGSIASQQLGFLWLVYVAGPGAAVALGVMLRLHLAAFGVVALVTQPLWPAVADAVARSDSAWARRAYGRAAWLAVAYAAVYGIGLVTAGSLVIQVWTGTHVQVPPPMLILFGLYFLAGVWQHVNAITLVGLGKIWLAARVLCLEAALACLGAVVLIKPFGANGVVVALLVATAAVSGTVLPYAVRRSWPAVRGSVDPLAASSGTVLDGDGGGRG